MNIQEDFNNWFEDLYHALRLVQFGDSNDGNGLDVDKVHEDGKTTLEKEIDNRNLGNIEFLINCGSDINVCDDHNKNLIYKEILRGCSNYKMIDFLISQGANIDHKDHEERTVIDDIVEIIAITKGLKIINTKIYYFI